MIPTRRQVANALPGFTMGQCCQYRRGVSDAMDESVPQSKAYAYLAGYADAIGDEAYGEPWYSIIAGYRISECWWSEDE